MKQIKSVTASFVRHIWRTALESLSVFLRNHSTRRYLPKVIFNDS